MNLKSEVCEKLNITRDELAEKLGISKMTVDSRGTDGSRMSKTAKVALKLMLENHELKQILNSLIDAQELLQAYKNIKRQ